MSQKSTFKTGMYLLETLTAGMYNEPLSIYREYIQNSVDSIDLISEKETSEFIVNIELDPFEKNITIKDNGSGLSSDIAENVLCALGSSNKRSNSNLRGFRGIGRLGGIAFSDRAVFRTKASGEKVESIQEWDCQKLRTYLADPGKANLSLIEVVKDISKFRKANCNNTKESYFSVSLDGVSSFRNHIFDLKKVINYLSQNAPVSFNPDIFSFGHEINNWLSEKVPNYGNYKILINDIPVYKPYSDEIHTNKKGSDHLVDIERIELKVNDETVAYGWYGVRKNLLGGITKGMGTSGLRVKVGNILIGDDHLLDGCFRESRFNSYMMGEIHVDCPYLVPNSRRDDFVDNEFKTLFYNEIERKIGLPLSKEIRRQSRIATLKPKSERMPLNGIGQKILAHSEADKILYDILKTFSSHKELNKILSMYSLA